MAFRTASSGIIIAGLIAIQSTSIVAAATADQERACRPDVSRLCRKVLQAGDNAIADCLRANIKKLRPQCRQIIQGRR